jgi:hypothetical protein
MFQHVSLLCRSICVCFQQSCFSIRGPTVVFQHLRFSLFHFCVAASVFASNSRVSAFVVQQSCFSIYVSTCFTFVMQHLCSLPTVVFQHLRFNMFHFCVAASVFASNSRVSTFVVQQSCFSIYVSALVLQHLCSYKQS